MTQVKICGITNLEDALVAVEAGTDLLGFIFYEPSPRYVAPEVVQEIVSSVKRQVAGGKWQVASRAQHATRNTQYVRFIGVFVNATLETITHTLDDCQLDAAQLHGDESPEFVNHFQNRAYKALRPQSLEEAELLTQKYLPATSPPYSLLPTPYSLLPISYSLLPTPYSLLPTPYFLIDAYHPTRYGGTGHVTDWTMAANIARQYPILLAGSLTPANVAEAIRTVKPWGVDVSSGVEAAKGKKDHDKVREFIQSAKSVTSDT
jgi:phosphoribosylanthranilate isomerase